MEQLISMLAHHISTPARIEVARRVIHSLGMKHGSFTKVAAELGISRTTLYLWLWGRLGPSDSSLTKLLKYVNSWELISILERDLEEYRKSFERFKSAQLGRTSGADGISS